MRKLWLLSLVFGASLLAAEPSVAKTRVALYMDCATAQKNFARVRKRQWTAFAPPAAGV